MIQSLREEIFSTSRSSVSPDENLGEGAKDKLGTVVTMISAEAEAVGKFVGDCISTPIIQAGTLLSVLSYMLYTEPLLGLVVLGIAVPQVVIVPWVQRRINVQVRERARTLRHAGDLIVEDMQEARGSVSSLYVYDRLFAGRARHPAHRDCRFCSADPRWAQSRRRLRIGQNGE
jgi:ABC-type multidrug transport system fused ATPase/permease subunit